MHKKSLVSVIVPVYNGEKYIAECLDSILNQSYKNIEIIVVDDGSKDKTSAILKSYARRSGIITILRQKNSGVSTARNRAINEARGDFVCFVDADDCLNVKYIEYLMGLINRYDAEISLTPQPYRFNKNNLNDKNDKRKGYIRVLTGDEAVKEMLYYKFAIGPWNKIIKMDLIRKCKISFDEKLRFGEGFNFSIDCFQGAKKVVVGSQKFYNYRVDNAESVMTKFSVEMVDGSLAAQERIKNNLSNSNKEMLRACKYAKWHTCCDLLMAMVGCKVTKKYPEMYQEVKRISRKDAPSAFFAPIPFKERVKGLMYFVAPVLAAKIVNRLRLRKFTVDN